MAGDTAHLGSTVTSPRVGAVSGPGPTALRLAVENDPFSLDWLGLAVCPVGARFSGAAIGWHESPSLPSGDAHRRRGGVLEHPSFPRGGHNKAEDWVVENQRPLLRDLTLAFCS